MNDGDNIVVEDVVDVYLLEIRASNIFLNPSTVVMVAGYSKHESGRVDDHYHANILRNSSAGNVLPITRRMGVPRPGSACFTPRVQFRLEVDVYAVPRQQVQDDIRQDL